MSTARMIDEVTASLHSAGWSSGDAVIRERGRAVWVVICSRGEHRIFSIAIAQKDAWSEALRLATGM